MYIYNNGEFVRDVDAVISPFDHGFLYGLGLFETFPMYNGHPFLLDDHLARLNESLKELQIQIQFSREQVLPILKELCALNSVENAYVRFNVSAGVGEVGLQTTPYVNPKTIVFMKPLNVEDGIKEKELSLLQIRRNTPEGLIRYKSHHYLNNIFGKREAGTSPLVEGLFLTEKGFIAEGIVSNVFFIKENTVFTPSIETGILNGITRMFLISLAKKQGLSVEEGFYSVEDMIVADEIFLTNSIQEVVAVKEFKGKKFPGKDGATTKQLFESYQSAKTTTLWSKDELNRKDNV